VARLGLRSTTAAATITGNELVFVTDATTGKQYATVDLSTFPGSRTAIQYLDFVPLNDFNFNVPNIGQAPFKLGPFSFSGNLTNGGVYSYRAQEVTGQAASGTFLTSPASNPTQYIVANQIRATGEITASGAPVPTNTGADIDWYRQGGTFLDGLYRKIARVSPTASSTGTYWSWSTANGVYTFDDFTPDSFLESSPDFDFLLQDHTTPPTACLAVGAYANRLALMAPAGLYISQLQSGVAAGLYYDLADDSSAPNAPIQGFFSAITGNDGTQNGGTSTRLVNFLNRLWLLFPNAVYEFGGSDQFDFAIHRFEASEGHGLIAPRAVMVFGNALWYLSSDGLRVIDGYRSTRVSQIIDKLLNPGGAFAGAPLSATAYANASLFAAAGRIYLSAPVPGGNDIAVLYVFDERAGGVWTSWTLPAGHTAVYHGATFSPSADTDDVCLLGGDGQIYLVGPNGAQGDTLVSGGAVQPVTMSVTSRRYLADPGWDLHVARGSLIVAGGDAATTATITYTGDTTASNQYVQPFAFAGGPGIENDLSRFKVASRVRGRAPYWSFAATTTADLSLKRVEMLATSARKR
jgi:hypothetical protein